MNFYMLLNQILYLVTCIFVKFIIRWFSLLGGLMPNTLCTERIFYILLWKTRMILFKKNMSHLLTLLCITCSKAKLCDCFLYKLPLRELYIPWCCMIVTIRNNTLWLPWILDTLAWRCVWKVKSHILYSVCDDLCCFDKGTLKNRFLNRQNITYHTCNYYQLWAVCFVAMVTRYTFCHNQDACPPPIFNHCILHQDLGSAKVHISDDVTP